MAAPQLSEPLRFEVDIESFAGPFDLLLALVLRDGIEMVDVHVLAICVRYLELLEAQERLDLDAASDFLVLVSALCELKARRLLPREDADELPEPEEAAEELAARLAEYARARAAAAWLRRRLDEAGRRIFREGPPALRARPPEVAAGWGEASALRDAVARLLEPPAPVEVAHLPRRNLPFRRFLDHVRRALLERGLLTFDEAVDGLDRMEQAMAFWAVLELYKRGEVRIAQEEPFAPIHLARATPSRRMAPVAAHVEEEAIA